MYLVPMHTKVTENITGSIFETLHRVYAQPEGFSFRGIAYLEILSSFYSFVLMAFTVSTMRDLKKKSVMWYMSELFHSLGHRCPAVL